MDFESALSNLENRNLLERAIHDVEVRIHQCSWTVGIDPAALSASYTAPVATEIDEYVLENQLEDLCIRHADLKIKRDAIPS